MTIKFFLTPYYIPDNYAPESIALAEGFTKLGIDYFANIDYWFEHSKGEYLFKESNSGDYDIAIYDFRYLYHSLDYTLNRVDTHKINVFIDRNDWLDARWNEQRILDKFDIILVDHMLQGFQYPQKVKPWAIGLTSRILEYTDRYRDSEITLASDKIVSNFRVDHNLRSLLVSKLDKQFSKHFQILHKTTDEVEIVLDERDLAYKNASANRHNPLFYKELNETIVTYAFGGYYEYRPFLYQPYTIWKKIARKPFHYYNKILDKMHMDISPSIFVFQYDSFRFWEVLYSNSCPIHLDFEDWGFILPEMPTEGKHYLGIKRLDVETFSQRVKNMSNEEIYQISQQGREWVDLYYSPKAVALRLLSHIEAL